MHGVSDVSGAAPVWRELMAHLHARVTSAAPAPPGGQVAQQGEWFLAGTEPGGHRTAARGLATPRFGIHAPRDGSVVVLDPEIPMAAQRLVLEGQSGQWFVGARLVGRGTLVSWLPRPGRHVLELRSAEGVDRVVFEVRAAPAGRPLRTPSG